MNNSKEKDLIGRIQELATQEGRNIATVMAFEKGLISGGNYEEITKEYRDSTPQNSEMQTKIFVRACQGVLDAETATKLGNLKGAEHCIRTSILLFETIGKFDECSRYSEMIKDFKQKELYDLMLQNLSQYNTLTNRIGTNKKDVNTDFKALILAGAALGLGAVIAGLYIGIWKYEQKYVYFQKAQVRSVEPCENIVKFLSLASDCNKIIVEGESRPIYITTNKGNFKLHQGNVIDLEARQSYPFFGRNTLDGLIISNGT